MLHSRDPGDRPGHRGAPLRSDVPMPAAFRVALAGCRAVACAALLATAPLSAATLADVQRLVDAGRFREDDAATRDALAFERERMKRIRIDFHRDRADIEARVRAEIPDLRADELAKWDAAGLFEKMTIDGEVRYFDRAASNLFRLSPEALARRRPGAPRLSAGPLESPHAHHREVVRDARDATRRVHVDYSLTVEADAVPAGKTVRAWLPFPRELPGQQEGVALVSSSPAKHRIAPASTLQRTVYLERTAEAGKATAFAIGYELTIHAQHNAIDPAKVVATPKDAALDAYLREAPPHIVFTPAVRAFSENVLAGETNPYRVAEKLFDAVDAFPWAGAREYSTLRNIPDYVLASGHGDCGQQTLLLVTLLRLNGVPARWQSGWVFSDGEYDTMHDWGWLYLAPYGWVPMDVTFGKLASDDADIARFYLGSLDAYRIAFNDAIATDFVPKKRWPRSETVDSQRGEVEWDGGNLYFDQWDYAFRWRLLPRRGSARDG
jgi:transglutaminase-like putative cysteine protease